MKIAATTPGTIAADSQRRIYACAQEKILYTCTYTVICVVKFRSQKCSENVLLQKYFTTKNFVERSFFARQL